MLPGRCGQPVGLVFDLGAQLLSGRGQPAIAVEQAAGRKAAPKKAGARKTAGRKAGVKKAGAKKAAGRKKAAPGRKKAAARKTGGRRKAAAAPASESMPSNGSESMD